MLNLLTLRPGDVLELKDGSQGAVVENMGDGIWLKVRDLASGDENPVHCEEIIGLAEGSAGGATR